MIKEKWKPVKGFENFYEVSNLGRLRALACQRFSKRHNAWRQFKSYIRKTNGQYGGMIQLRGDEERMTIQFHRLVALHFVPNPKKLPMVCHQDDNDRHNTADNLYWGTHKSNGKDAVRNDKIISPWLGKKLSDKHKKNISRGLKRRA